MKKEKLLTTLLSLITIFFFTTFAYSFYELTDVKDTVTTASITSGRVNIVFKDGTTAFEYKPLIAGEKALKTFTIDNTVNSSSIEATIYFKDLINSYMEGSLVYTLSYSANANGDYTVLAHNRNVPRSSTSKDEPLYGKIYVPAGAKYYYKLEISLNNFELVDTSDVDAVMRSMFFLELGYANESKLTLDMLGFTANEGTPDFSVTPATDNGIFSAEDNYGTSYYFRGNVNNNRIMMGSASGHGYECIYGYGYDTSDGGRIGYYSLEECEANRQSDASASSECYEIDRECSFHPFDYDLEWKIIRINGDGTLRIQLVQGISNTLVDPSTEDFGTRNYSESSLQYVNSIAKQELETWYEKFLLNDYDQYISKTTMFCNDLNYYKREDIQYSASTSITFDFDIRKNNPSLYCNRPKLGINFGHTQLTVNSGLKYPIALITADEAVMVGKSYGWTMTPAFTTSKYGYSNWTSGYIMRDVYLETASYEDDDYKEDFYPVINLTKEAARKLVWNETQNAYILPE